jgi:hypothetical protein
MKRILHSLVVMPLAIATMTSTINPASALPIVRPIAQSVAQGMTGNGAVVMVWAGSGTNIDFTRTGEVIERAWLDDSHAIVVDFDAPLTQRSGASIVHLKRVTGIHFPNQPETDSTLLTIITRSSYGKKTYLFEVRYGSGTPQYAALAVTPDSQVGGGLTIGNRTANWGDVERGLERAIARQLLPATSPIVPRVKNFLALVRNGVPMQQATEQAKLSPAIISKLAEMGVPLPQLHRAAP